MAEVLHCLRNYFLCSVHAQENLVSFCVDDLKTVVLIQHSTAEERFAKFHSSDRVILDRLDYEGRSMSNETYAKQFLYIKMIFSLSG